MTPSELRREKPKSRSGALALLLATVISLTVGFGAIVGSMGSGAMQQALRTMGFGRETAMQAEQRRQAASIAELDAIVRDLNVALETLKVRAELVEHKEEAASGRLSKIDDAFAALRTSVSEVRAAQVAMASQEPWRKPIDQLMTAVTRARGEIGALRASLDGLDQARHTDSGAIGKRINRLEQAMLERNMPGSIRGSIQGVVVRPVTEQGATSADTGGKGHILNFAPAVQ